MSGQQLISSQDLAPSTTVHELEQSPDQKSTWSQSFVNMWSPDQPSPRTRYNANLAALNKLKSPFKAVVYSEAEGGLRKSNSAPMLQLEDLRQANVSFVPDKELGDRWYASKVSNSRRGRGRLGSRQGSRAGSSSSTASGLPGQDEGKAAGIAAAEEMILGIADFQLELGEIAVKLAENPWTRHYYDLFWSELLDMALQLKDMADPERYYVQADHELRADEPQPEAGGAPDE